MTAKLTPVEVARELGITLDYVYKEIRAGRFQGAIREDGQWRIPASAVKDRLERRRKRLAETVPAGA